MHFGSWVMEADLEIEAELKAKQDRDNALKTIMLTNEPEWIYGNEPKPVSLIIDNLYAFSFLQDEDFFKYMFDNLIASVIHLSYNVHIFIEIQKEQKEKRAIIISQIQRVIRLFQSLRTEPANNIDIKIQQLIKFLSFWQMLK